LIDVFISYAPTDSEWAKALANHLADYGLKIFYDRWSLGPGDVIVHKLEDAIRASASGIMIVGPATLASRRAMEEYAALLGESDKRDMPLIPLLAGPVDAPPFLANRVWRRLPGTQDPAFAAVVTEIAKVIQGELPDGAADPAANFESVMPSKPRPLTEPHQRMLAVCYVEADQDYGQRLVRHLREAGLPTWSIADIRPGEWRVWVTRQRIAYATTIIVLESPRAEESDDITRMILEGERHGRQFYPILLDGDRHYLLAPVRHLDARDSRLPADGELDILRQMVEADAAGTRLDLAAVAPATPGARPTTLVANIPLAQALRRLDGYLAERQWEHADLQTTTILLTEAGRLVQGFLRPSDGGKVTDGLLGQIDALWGNRTHGHQGFRAQHARASADGRFGEFTRLAEAFGWSEPSERYENFARQCGPRGFFPTLRYPHDENNAYYHWHEHWTGTVLVVHRRIHTWLEGNKQQWARSLHLSSLSWC
jgi:hypothetical protein